MHHHPVSHRIAQSAPGLASGHYFLAPCMVCCGGRHEQGQELKHRGLTSDEVKSFMAFQFAVYKACMRAYCAEDAIDVTS